MPGQNRQPSFGGVAQLFGDSSATEDKAPKQRQASFGGVASLFGDDDDENAGSVSAPANSRRAPSFGGVANLFGGDDNQGAPKPTGKTGRQASFGGVAALFGDEDDEVPDRINTKPKKGGARQASFGGVAALFGENEEVGAVGQVQSSDEPAKPQSDSIGPLKTPPAPAKGRSKKRDPSFGGVAGLFADNDEEDEDEEDQDIAITFKPSVNDKRTTELQIEVENEREKVIELQGELKQAEKTNKQLEERIRELEKEKKILTQSKVRLIKQTSQEIDRMREVIIGIARETASQQNKAQTVS